MVAQWVLARLNAVQVEAFNMRSSCSVEVLDALIRSLSEHLRDMYDILALLVVSGSQ